MFVTYLPMTNHSLIFQVTSRGWIVDETESPIFVHGLSNSGARDKKGHTAWGEQFLYNGSAVFPVLFDNHCDHRGL